MAFEFYRGVKVLVTGHTGFKGSWLCAYLKGVGASVSGLALAPETDDRPALFDLARISSGMTSVIGDIRTLSVVENAIASAQPQVIFHLAGQALVRRAYRDPLGTFATNALGTAHVLEAARNCPSVRAVVCVTTDKVYQNHEWPWPYRETDELGGKDPYSASKACAELVAACYIQSLLPLSGEIKLATARGGNVVGGGDWSEDRLVPDIVRALATDRRIVLRNPAATRPWQHVLELVRAYLTLGQRLLEGDNGAIGAWNFGPNEPLEMTVEQVVKSFAAAWGEASFDVQIEPSSLKEAQALRLDVSKAASQLGWRPMLGIEEAIGMTADWYKRCKLGEDAGALVEEQIRNYDERFAQWRQQHS